MLATEFVWVGIPALLAILGVAALRQSGRAGFSRGAALTPVPVPVADSEESRDQKRG